MRPVRRCDFKSYLSDDALNWGAANKSLSDRYRYVAKCDAPHTQATGKTNTNCKGYAVSTHPSELRHCKGGMKRPVLTINGEPHFVAADVCKALEISNSRMATDRLDDDEKNTIVLNDGIGNPNKNVVTESGLYYTFIYVHI